MSMNRNATLLLSKDQIMEIKYLEIKDNPEYWNLCPSDPEVRKAEDKAIAREATKAGIREGIRRSCEEMKRLKMIPDYNLDRFVEYLEEIESKEDLR